jgi:hypothetical protein
MQICNKVLELQFSKSWGPQGSNFRQKNDHCEGTPVFPTARECDDSCHFRLPPSNEFFLCLNHFQFIHTFMCSSVAIFSMVKSIYSVIQYICKFYHLKTDVISKIQVSFEPMWKQALSPGLVRTNFWNLHKNFPK